MDTQDEVVTKSEPVKAKPRTRNGNGNRGQRNGNGGANFLEHENELGQCYSALLGYRNGDFTARLPHTWSGTLGKIAEVRNEIMISSARRAGETSRISRVVGAEGKLRERFSSAGLVGGWADEIASLNRLIDDLVSPTAEVTRAVGAVAKGDLAQSIALDRDGRPLEGEFLTSAKLVNTMIEQLSVFASEVPRGARSWRRRQARRPSSGERRQRRVEGSDRERQLDGQQLDRPGAQYIRGDDCRGQRRLVA